MWYGSVVTTAPASLPVSVADVKARCRVDGNDDDATIEAMIEEVTAYAERRCNLRIMPQTVMAKCDSFSDFLRLPDGPLEDDAIQSISFIDGNGDPQTLPSNVYELRVDGLEACITTKFGQSWPDVQSDSRITVVMQVGYSSVPYDLRSAILARVAEMFAAPENATRSVWSDFDDLLVNFRRG